MIEDAFNMIDTDGSGKVDKKEYEAALEAYGLAQKSKNILAQLKNKNQTRANDAPQWEQVLEELDEDMNGQISWQELKAFLQTMEEEHGFELSKEDWKQIKGFFEMVDTDGSGEVDEKEFHDAVATYGLGQMRRLIMKKITQKK